jgi:uncharacterized protein YkwD
LALPKKSTVTTLPIKVVKTSLPTPYSALPQSVVVNGGSFNADEIVALTNIERVKHGLSPLRVNSTLTQIALAKAKDMIDKQYFEHVSPDGTDIGKLAQQYGYAYVHIGENLALGDFASSSHVVNGWMDSPGHRANILGSDFVEIGVSAVRGMWQGRMVWWSVQEFGHPMPACDKPDEVVRKKIEIYEAQLSSIRDSIVKLKSAIEDPTTSRDTYLIDINEYNATVDLFNRFLAEEKALVVSYNAEVANYNECIKG